MNVTLVRACDDFFWGNAAGERRRWYLPSALQYVDVSGGLTASTIYPDVAAC